MMNTRAGSRLQIRKFSTDGKVFIVLLNVNVCQNPFFSGFGLTFGVNLNYYRDTEGAIRILDGG